MYAIIKDRGKQYKVRAGERHLIDLKSDKQAGIPWNSMTCWSALTRLAIIRLARKLTKMQK